MHLGRLWWRLLILFVRLCKGSWHKSLVSKLYFIGIQTLTISNKTRWGKDYSTWSKKKSAQFSVLKLDFWMWVRQFPLTGYWCPNLYNTGKVQRDDRCYNLIICALNSGTFQWKLCWHMWCIRVPNPNLPHSSR